MTPDAHVHPADRFREALDEQLAALGSEWVPRILARACLAAITADSSASAADVLSELPMDLGHVDLNDAVEDHSEETWAEAIAGLEDEVVGVLAGLVEHCEQLISIDLAWPDFSNSGGYLYLVRHRNRAFTVNTLHDLADPWYLEHLYDEPDEQALRAWLEHLIDSWAPGVGIDDIRFNVAYFDEELRSTARQMAEEAGNAPWQRGELESYLPSDRTEAERIAEEQAPALGVSVEDVRTALERLAQNEEPSSEMERRLAWRITWPDLHF